MSKTEKKKTFTYYGTPSVRDRAMKKADKEGMTLGEVVDGLLALYVKTKKGALLQSQKRKTVLVFGSEQYELK